MYIRVEQGALLSNSAVMISVDLLCVKGLFEDDFVATLLRHTWCLTKTRRQLHMRCFRCHTGDVGAPSPSVLLTVAHDLHYMCGDGGLRKMEDGKSRHLLRRSPCDEALRVMWPGPSDSARCDPNSEYAVQALGVVTTEIAVAATECGAAK